MRLSTFTLACLFMCSTAGVSAQVSQRYTDKVANDATTFVSKRPPMAERLFKSKAIEKEIKRVKAILKGNPRLAWMFENCYPNTLETTVHYRVKDGDDDTFVYTGDIPAMWQRDSGAQVWPYVRLVNEDPQLALFSGSLRIQISIDMPMLSMMVQREVNGKATIRL